MYVESVDEEAARHAMLRAESDGDDPVLTAEEARTVANQLLEAIAAEPDERFFRIVLDR